MKRTRLALGAALAAMLFGGGSWARGDDAPSDADAVFKKLDKNGDGKLTKSEIPDEQSRFFERLVRLGDKNSDGELTLEEFQQANKPEERPNVPLGPQGGDAGGMSPRQRFEMLDRNKDGKITLDEVPEPLRDRLKPVFEKSGKQELTLEDFGRLGEAGAARPEPGEFFKRLDTNGDGKLTVDEAPDRAKPMVENVLRHAGKERDGSLTRDEFIKNLPTPPRDGDGARRPEGERKPGGERRAEGDRANANVRQSEGERREGDRRPEAGQTRDGERRPEAAGERTRDGDRPPQGGRGPAIFRMLDTNNDGRLSKDELAKVAEKFDELDKNHDGQLDPLELIGGPPGPADVRGERRPEAERASPEERRTDVDRRTEEGDRRSEAAQRDAGRPADATGRDAASGRDARNPEPGAFFKRLDQDGDGKISRDEAPEPMKERFPMLDTNGDGFVTQEEFRAAARDAVDRPRERRPDGERNQPKRD